MRQASRWTHLCGRVCLHSYNIITLTYLLPLYYCILVYSFVHSSVHLFIRLFVCSFLLFYSFCFGPIFCKIFCVFFLSGILCIFLSDIICLCYVYVMFPCCCRFVEFGTIGCYSLLLLLALPNFSPLTQCSDCVSYGIIS